MIHTARSFVQGVALAGTLLFLCVSSPVLAQPVPEPDPAYVESVDAIMAAIYEVISGPTGQARDWDRMRSLLHPEARLIPSGRNPETGQGGIRYLSVEDYISGPGQQLETSGFFEVEIHRVEERFADIAHIFSTYESRRTSPFPTNTWAADATRFDANVDQDCFVVETLSPLKDCFQAV